MNAITFRFFIGLVVSKTLDMCLMDRFITNIYGSLDKDNHVKIPEGFKILEAFYEKPRIFYSIKLQKSLYGLKQYGRIWYNRFNE
jgi:hypothetical protein